MSNTVRYDPLLASRLADELNERLRGRRCAANPVFAADRSATLLLEGGEQLRADLHPSRGWIRILPAQDAFEPDAVCLGVAAPDDERRIEIELQEIGRFRDRCRRLVLELATNQWNAILVGEDDRVHGILRRRRDRVRWLDTGQPYTPPARVARYDGGGETEADARARWEREIGQAPAEARRAVLLDRFAAVGSASARWILEPLDAGEEGCGRAFERWWWLRGNPPPSPGLLDGPAGGTPYPVALAGWPHTPYDSLLTAMEGAAAQTAAEDGAARAREPDPDLAAAAAWVDARVKAGERKIRRLREQLAAAAGAAEVRALGDLLLAKLHEVPRGADSVRLRDWEDAEVEILLYPQLAPAENATRLYDRARRMERAAAEIPGRLAEAEREVEGWRGAAAAVGRGEVPGSVREILIRREARDGSREVASPALPYRRYRTSGGLEVRVGRGSKENDRLTFRESAPNDVWLHARSVPGSHVILRWPDADAAPPARDLAEAAQLAALFSRARTSSLVAVDWTRRKHVRKPRGAPPGLVIPQRVKTVFVEPDPAVIERMAAAE